MHGQASCIATSSPRTSSSLPEGHLKLLDFGIALDEAARRLTWFGLSSTIGTPDYMAPEQVGGRRGDAVPTSTRRAPCSTRCSPETCPIRARMRLSLMRAKQDGEPGPSRQLVSSISPEVEEIIMHAIERSPRYRYETAKPMLEELRDPSKVKPRGDDQRTRGPADCIPRRKSCSARSWRWWRSLIAAPR